MLKKLSKKEIILYASSLAVAIIGLVILIIGVVADNLGVDSKLYQFQAKFPFRYLGLIIISVAVIFAIIVLCVYAKKVDRVSDRELRRKQRLSAMMSDIEQKEEIVVSEGKIVEENKPVEEKEEEVETKPVDPIEPKVEEAKIDPVNSQPTEPKPEEVKPDPTVSQPTEVKPEEVKPEEVKPNPTDNEPTGDK